ncbi:hypothetical protein L6452_36005 [Arctium lappa]|uniref:Uncharacterized protein n=1 Tax=Arctium lappa TaxID=4217 RepID=A0ACB8Y949_ARCLA|nr:hypothetical protein L6452_36005 [Arctium lappa]
MKNPLDPYFLLRITYKTLPISVLPPSVHLEKISQSQISFLRLTKKILGAEIVPVKVEVFEEENKKVARLPHTNSSHVQSIRLPVTKSTLTFSGEDHNQSRLFVGRSYYPRQIRFSQVTRIRELLVRELITNLCGKRSVDIAREARDVYYERCRESSTDSGGDGRILKHRPILVVASVGSYGAYLADGSEYRVVLVELVTGRKAVDLKRPKGQQCLAEWARPLLEEDLINELIDPRLRIRYSKDEVYCMMQAASLCIKRDPHLRPHMSQVLRMLEGDIMKGSSRSGRIVMDEARYMIGGGGGNGMKEMSTTHCYWESDRIMRG